jgi:hypothetical protein
MLGDRGGERPGVVASGLARWSSLRLVPVRPRLLGDGPGLAVVVEAEVDEAP